ncbi:MAG: hypothetical protein ACP5I8_10840 [Phycisphaerae bacterium]
MESVVPQAACRHRKHDNSRRDAGAPVFATEYHQGEVYVPGDGKEQKPEALVTTGIATMKGVTGFGPMVKLEGNRRGIARAAGGQNFPAPRCRGKTLRV